MKRFFLLLLALAVPAAAQTAFQNYVMTELPKRPVMLTSQNVQDGGFDLDPNDGGPPAVLSLAPRGTFFLRATGPTLYVKGAPDAGTWSTVAGSGGSGLPLMTGPVSLYLSPSGSDTTGDGTIGNPLQTFAGIRNKIRSTWREVGYLITVIPAAGNYPTGPLLTGLTFVPLDETQPVGVFVNGPWANATVATGTATGTLTSVTAGTSAPAVPTVVADSTQSWTSNDLADKFLAVNGNYWPIVSNTGTTITLAGPVSVTTSTYAIVEGSAVVTGSTAVFPPIPAAGAATATPKQASIVIHSNNMGRLPGTLGTPPAVIRIEGIKVAPSSAGAGYNSLFAVGSSIIVNRCFLGGTAASGNRIEFTVDSGRSQLTNSVVKTNASSNGLAVSGVGAFNADGNVFTSYASGAIAMVVGGLAPGSNLIASANNCTIKSHTTAGINIASQTVLTLSGTTITGAGQGVRYRLADNSLGNGFVNATGLAINSSSGAALDFTGPILLQAGTVTGTGNTVGWSLGQGTKMKVGSASTLTGTTEISLDGTSYTLSTMRGNSPKLISSTYFTVMWE